MDKVSSTLEKQPLLEVFPLMGSILNLRSHLIVVEGISGSGKTRLAKEILHFLDNTIYIDGLESKETFMNKPYSKDICDFTKNYLIENPDKFHQENLTKYINGIIGRGGLTIIFCHHIKDINAKILENKNIYLNLKERMIVKNYRYEFHFSSKTTKHSVSD